MLTCQEVRRIYRESLYVGIRYTHNQAWDEWNRLIDRLLSERKITQHLWANIGIPFPKCEWVSVTWKRRLVTA